MKGTYILIIRISNNFHIQIGKIGVLFFRKGYYSYIGSAMNNLEKRISRHLSKSKKRFWHIDHLLAKSNVIRVYIKESEYKQECELANKISINLEEIPNFGSSDCKCKSHLFFSKSVGKLSELIENAGFILYKNS